MARDPEKTLSQLADELPKGAFFDVYRSYCAAKDAGVKTRTIEASRLLVNAFAELSRPDQQAIADQLLGLWRSVWHPQLLPHPLKLALIKTLTHWHQNSDEAVPARWLGILEQDPSWIDKALLRDPDDQIALVWRVNNLLNAIDFQCHHLNEGHFIGEIDDARETSAAVQILLPRIRDIEIGDRYTSELAGLAAMVEAYAVYRETDRKQSFPNWSRDRGESFRFHAAYYYDARW
jgi:hypothetical protein